MSQLGMQLPGSGAARKPRPNIYTGLAFFAVVCLGAAVAMMWITGSRLAPPDAGAMGPLTLQEPGAVKLD